MHLLELEAGYAGIEPRDLEEVLDELLEAIDVTDHEVEGRARPFGHVLALVVHHLDGRRQGHQRRAELVADVGGEPGVALDAVLEGLGHVVERRRDGTEVRVLADLEPGVEQAVGECHGRRRHAGERAQGPAARPRPQSSAGQGGEQRRADEGHPEGFEGGLEVVEGDDLEVGRVDRGDGDPDDELHLAAQLVAHAHRLAAQHGLPHGVGEGVLPELRGERHELLVRVQHGARPEGRRQRADQRLLVGVGRDASPHDAGVLVHDHRRRVLPLVEQVLAGQRPGGGGQQGREEQRTDGEGQRDAGPEAESPGDVGEAHGVVRQTWSL